MDEVLYMLGSGAAVILLVGHVVRLLVVRARSGTAEENAKLRALEGVCMELRDELRRLREDQGLALEDLTERVEFAERLLARTSERSDAARPADPA